MKNFDAISDKINTLVLDPFFPGKESCSMGTTSWTIWECLLRTILLTLPSITRGALMPYLLKIVFALVITAHHWRNAPSKSD